MPDSPWPNQLVCNGITLVQAQQSAQNQYLTPHEMSAEWKKAFEPKEWLAKMERKNAVLGSDFSPKVEVTDQMVKDGVMTWVRTALPIEGIVTAVYRSMHAAAPVELVSEGERQALKERDKAYEYLRGLFEHLAPQSTPLPDLMGLCTQIDNVMAGLRIDRDKAREADFRCRLAYYQRELAKRPHPSEVEARVSGLMAENMALRDRVGFLEGNVAPVDSTPKPFPRVPTDDPRRMGWRGNR